MKQEDRLSVNEVKFTKNRAGIVCQVSKRLCCFIQEGEGKDGEKEGGASEADSVENGEEGGASSSGEEKKAESGGGADSEGAEKTDQSDKEKQKPAKKKKAKPKSAFFSDILV